jgi:hypothetical protein
MSKKKDTQAPSSFPEKWFKVVQAMPEFKDIADAASIDDLKKIIVDCEGNIYTIDQDKENNSKLIAAQELVKEYKAPYTDAIKAQTAKIKYALFLLEGKGVDLDNKD